MFTWNPVLLQTLAWGLQLEIRLFGLFAALVASVVYPIYIMSMVRGEQRPPPSAWFLGVALDGVAFGSRWMSGNFDALLAIYAIGTLVTALFTLKYGKEHWESVDSYCTAIVIGALGAWWIIGPSAATICAMGGMTVACWPLLKNVWDGAYESRPAWGIAPLGSIFNVLDGQYLTGIWFAALQLLIFFYIVKHWGWTAVPQKVSAAR